ncbi:secreted protein [Bathymodiolus azoricus thioautotrophic gill symbiont]|uniref:Secreted protein n=1 Tax=Bathymodiolus azoricus thioautotrophic gill symbiont TaxID=235205 RepID=A0A1H6JZ92_9GAMM|nr:secreted protein [Bathymodiolus azoricus thioautotrophic gill symbiont]
MAKTTTSSIVRVSLISSSRVKTPFLSAVVLSICQALAMGFGAPTSTENGKFLPLNICISVNLAPTS